MAEIRHHQDPKNAGMMIPTISHLIHHSGTYKTQMDCGGWHDIQKIWPNSNPNCSYFVRCGIFARYTGLSTQCSESHLPGKCVLFHPYQKVGSEAVCIHVQWTKYTYIHLPQRYPTSLILSKITQTTWTFHGTSRYSIVLMASLLDGGILVPPAGEARNGKYWKS